MGTRISRAVGTGAVAASLLVSIGNAVARGHQRAATSASCFILNEIGVGQVRRKAASSCSVRVTPQSTFKIPHALAALDAGVISENEVIAYDGHAVDWPSWGKDHALASALQYSVVWYFQDIARRLGADRERQYLRRLEYGNQDSSGGLTTFWLGRTLAFRLPHRGPMERSSARRRAPGQTRMAAPCGGSSDTFVVERARGSSSATWSVRICPARPRSIKQAAR